MDDRQVHGIQREDRAVRLHRARNVDGFAIASGQIGGGGSGRDDGLREDAFGLGGQTTVSVDRNAWLVMCRGHWHTDTGKVG